MASGSGNNSESTGVGSSNEPTIVELLSTKRKNDVFENFLLCKMSDNTVKARCKKCLKFYSAASNSSLRSHVAKHCASLATVPEEGQTSMARDGTIFSYSEERVREQFASFVIQDALPFNHFDNPRLTKVIQDTLQPRYTQVTRSTLKRKAMKMWKTAKKDLVTLFENLNTSVNLTTDVWSAPHGLPGSYICVTAHWVDPSTWQMMKRTIAFENFEYPHTGENLFYMLKSVMAYFKIEQKVFTISFDNASNNTNAVEKLKLTYTPVCNGAFYHGRCVAHILNLVVQDGLNVVELREIRHNFKTMLQDVFLSGKARYKNYMKLCKETDSIFLTPNWDMPTRWSSTHKMYQCALRQKETLKHFHDKLVRKGLASESFSNQNWAIIEKIVNLLKVFKNATTLLSGVYYPTSYLVINQIWLICETLGEYEYEGVIFEKMIEAMKKKLKKYFEEVPLVFTCAAALNPLVNVSGVEVLLEKITADLGLYNDDPMFEMREKDRFNTHFKTLFMVYFQKYGSSSASSSAGSSFFPTHQTSQNPVINMYNMIRNENSKRARGERASSNTSELVRYTSTNYLDTMGLEEMSTFDILDWWKTREEQYPVLSAMARDLLSVQASTVASESAFSTSGRVLSIRRTRLTPASLEMCICLKDHLDAHQRTQHTTSLELDALDFEQDIHNEEVEDGEVISLSDEEIQLDEAMRVNSSEEDQ
jgi:hypothetical protein